MGAIEPRRKQPRQKFSYSLHSFWNFPLRRARLSVMLTTDCLWRRLPSILLSGLRGSHMNKVLWGQLAFGPHAAGVLSQMFVSVMETAG
jgi:hypothetical protein